MHDKNYMVPLAEGDILVRMADNIRFRVVRLMGDDVVVFDMDAPANSALPPRDAEGKKCPPSRRRPRPAFPVTWQYPEVFDGLQNDTYTRVPADIPFINRKDLRPTEIAFQARALPIIEALFAREADMYDAEARAKLVQEVCTRHRVSRQTAYKYWRIYMAGGKTPAALISFYRHCGAPGKYRDAGSKRRGRPRSARMVLKLGIGVNTFPKDMPHIQSAVEKYRKETAWVIEEAYNWMLGRLYTEVVLLKDGRRSRDFDPSKVITFDQFDFHSGKFMTAEDKFRRQNERRATHWKKGRNFTGSQGSLPEVGEIAEIDAMRTNISICRAKNRAAVIGPAIVVIIVEYKSGMILGLAVGLAGEVYELVVEALVKSVSDKVAWCKKYGIHITPQQWPTRHFCQRLHADRGPAFFGRLSDAIAEVMSPNPFANTGPFDAPSKGGAENSVRLFKRVIRRRYPGAWLGKFKDKERGSRSPHELTAFNVAELTTELLDIAVGINEKVRKSRRTEPDLVDRGVDSSPVSIVTDALDTQRHRFRRIEPIALEQALLPRFPATVSLDGIDAGNELYYKPASVTDLNSDWYRKLELEKSKAQVAMHRDTVDLCFLVVPGQREKFVRCVRLSKSNQFAGMSLAEVKGYRQENSEVNRVKSAQDTPVRVQRSSDSRARAARAQAETRLATGNIPSSQRDIGNRRENRKAEQAEQRKALTNRLSGQGNPASTTDQPPARPSRAKPHLGFPDLDDL